MHYLLIIIYYWFPLIYNNECLVYLNEKQEIVIQDNHKLTYRLNNGGGLVTYTYFSGDYTKKKQRIVMGSDELEFSRIEEIEESYLGNQIAIYFEDNENKPIKYAPIIFDNSNILYSQKYYTDENGGIKIETDLFREISNCLRMNVLLFGNTFSQNICVKKGDKYSIKLLVPSRLGIQNSEQTKRKYIKIVPIDEDSVKIYDPNLRIWKYFNRLSNSSECHNLIFSIN